LLSTITIADAFGSGASATEIASARSVLRSSSANRVIRTRTYTPEQQAARTLSFFENSVKAAITAEFENQVRANYRREHRRLYGHEREITPDRFRTDTALANVDNQGNSVPTARGNAVRAELNRVNALTPVERMRHFITKAAELNVPIPPEIADRARGLGIAMPTTAVVRVVERTTPVASVASATPAPRPAVATATTTPSPAVATAAPTAPTTGDDDGPPPPPPMDGDGPPPPPPMDASTSAAPASSAATSSPDRAVAVSAAPVDPERARRVTGVVGVLSGRFERATDQQAVRSAELLERLQQLANQNNPEGNTALDRLRNISQTATRDRLNADAVIGLLEEAAGVPSSNSSATSSTSANNSNSSNNSNNNNSSNNDRNDQGQNRAPGRGDYYGYEDSRPARMAAPEPVVVTVVEPILQIGSEANNLINSTVVSTGNIESIINQLSESNVNIGWKSTETVSVAGQERSSKTRTVDIVDVMLQGDTYSENKSALAQAVAFVSSQLNMTEEQRKESQETLKQTASMESPVTNAAHLVSKILDNRMTNITLDQSGIVANARSGVSSGETGISSGDEPGFKNPIRGVWASGLFGSSKQGKVGKRPSYNGSVTGGSIGVDCIFDGDDDVTMGATYSNINSLFKSQKDKLNVDSHIFSLYNQSVFNKLILQASISFIKSNGVNKSLRLVANTPTGPEYKVASGKFNSSGFNLDSSASYKINFNKYSTDFLVLPTVGLRYGRGRDGGYSETGSGVYNMSIAAKSYKSLVATVGGKVMTSVVLTENIVATPMVGLALDGIIHETQQKNKTKLKWAKQEFTNELSNEQKSKVGFNLAAGVAFERKNMELSVNYNSYMKKKYVSHQGSLKLNILF